MPIAVALEDVQGTLVSLELEGGTLHRRSFIETGEAGSPQAFIVQYDPNRTSRVHFHEVDQFQIVVEGTGRIGRHELRPYSVHFARAHTPYGPLVASAEGMTFVTLRRRWDFGGAQRLPEAKAVLEQVPDRKPWQVTETVDFDRLPPAPPSGVLVEPIPAVKDDEGLAGHVVSMQPNASACAPDPSHGEGQFLLVLEGSLLYGGKEHNAMTVVSIDADEGPFQMQAGADGLKGLVVAFPRAASRHTVAAGSSDAGLKVWQCALCAFVYDETAGLPEEDIAPGTRWQDVPENWSCPDCAAGKADFQMVETSAAKGTNASVPA